MNYFQQILSPFASQDVNENSASQVTVRLQAFKRIHYCCCCLSGINLTFEVCLKVRLSTTNLVASSTALASTLVLNSTNVTPSSCFGSEFTEHSVYHYLYFRLLIDLTDSTRLPAWVHHGVCAVFLGLFEEIELRPFSTLNSLKKGFRLLLDC